MNDAFSFVTTIMDKINHYTFVEFTLAFIKGAAIIFVVVQLLSKYLKAKNANEIFSPRDIIRPFVLCAILGSYNYFMDGVENVLKEGDTYIQRNITPEGDLKAKLRQTRNNLKDTVEDKYDGLKLDADQYSDDYIASNTSQLVQFIKHPGSVLIKIFGWIGDFFGTFVYMASLMIRAFMLFALKLLGPIAVVFSIYDKWHNAIYNWLRYYAIYFLWIIPIYAANTFMDVVTNECYTNSNFTSFSVTAATTMVSLVGIIVKIGIIKGSLNLLIKLFANTQGE
ncbi:MAG: type IV secretion system protein [Bacteroidota bacterium]|nr:type IV secretion system protein [Bacteroidota bacterium]MDP4272651.1 type IV secretion system protein [Bacteroidota bacterium]